DQYDKAVGWFAGRSIDLLALLTAEGAVQIKSGRLNKAKLLYRLPFCLKPLPSKAYTEGGGDVVNFRCATADGLTVQDVLPPSIHPDTGKRYEWHGDWCNLPVIPQELLDVWYELLGDISEFLKPGRPPEDWQHIPTWELPVGVPKYTRALIEHGDTEGSYNGDRSAMQFGVMKDLIRIGVDDETIICVLVDPEYKIAEKPVQEAHGDISLAMKRIARQVGRAHKAVEKERADEVRQRETQKPPHDGERREPDMSWATEYVLTDKEAEEMSDPDWIYENLIIQGHLIVIPAPANAGKTTILMHIAGELAADYKVFYVNADVSGGDAKKMVSEAREKGYKLLLPDMKAGRSMDDVVKKVLGMNKINADYSGCVFFFDTLKKMTDVISKSRAKELYKTLRGLTAKGMTIVLLAHTNKYNDAEGRPIYEGTVDLRNDVDEMIYLVSQHHDDGGVTVSTLPDKKRGSHQPITFKISPHRKVTQVPEYVDVVAQTKEAEQRERDATIIEAISDAIRQGKPRQTEIVGDCREHGIGRRTVERVLQRYSGGPDRLWRREKAFQNNATIYSLV
ncbi:MAG: AAA family ATPase, partial [Gammaproteobacteria bacterium]